MRSWSPALGVVTPKELRSRKGEKVARLRPAQLRSSTERFAKGDSVLSLPSSYFKAASCFLSPVVLLHSAARCLRRPMLQRSKSGTTRRCTAPLSLPHCSEAGSGGGELGVGLAWLRVQCSAIQLTIQYSLGFVNCMNCKSYQSSSSAFL